MRGNFFDKEQWKCGILSTAIPLGFFEKLGQLAKLNALFAWSFLPGTAFHAPQMSLLAPRGLNSPTMLPKVNDQNDAKSQGNENQGRCPSLCTTLLPSGAEVLRHENQSALTQTPLLLHIMRGLKADEGQWCQAQLSHRNRGSGGGQERDLVGQDVWDLAANSKCDLGHVTSPCCLVSHASHEGIRPVKLC